MNSCLSLLMSFDYMYISVESNYCGLYLHFRYFFTEYPSAVPLKVNMFLYNL